MNIHHSSQLITILVFILRQTCVIQFIPKQLKVEVKVLVALCDPWTVAKNLRVRLFSSTRRSDQSIEFEVRTSAHLPAESLQSCLTLCHTADCSPPRSSVLGIHRPEHWNGWPFPPQGHIFPTQGSNLPLSASPALACGIFSTTASWGAPGIQ